MADTIKNASSGSINSGKMKDTMNEFGERVTDVAHDVAESFQENRPLMYLGIGVLVVAAGVGIWALIRQFSGEEYPSNYYRGTGSY